MRLEKTQVITMVAPRVDERQKGRGREELAATYAPSNARRDKERGNQTKPACVAQASNLRNDSRSEPKPWKLHSCCSS